MTAKVLLLFAFFLAAASAPAGDRMKNGKPVLYVYTWQNLIADDIIRDFEQKHGCIVDFDFYDSDDVMVAKLESGGGYDVVTPPGFSVPHLRGRGILGRLDHSLLPNLRHLTDDFVDNPYDPDMESSVTMQITITGIGYNPDLVSVPVDSWKIFADSGLAGKLTLMFDSRETLGAALKANGHSVNTSDAGELEAAVATLREWSGNLDRFAVDEAIEGLADGRYAAVHCYYGDLATARQDNPKLRFMVPEEGAVLNSNRLAICADSESPELAHAFINHLLDPEMAATNIRETNFLMPNKAAILLLGGIVSEHPIINLTPGLRAKCEPVLPLAPAEAELYEQCWSQVIIGG